jgi:SAM-dependent methyltransferase
MDNFSCQSDKYASIRPSYPNELFECLANNTENNLALDIGTGNGQCAYGLSKYYKNVIGIDISQKQLDSAYKRKNIEYYCVPAEFNEYHMKLFNGKQFDLITCAQSLHFFDLNIFYNNIKQILKPNTGLFVAWSYIHPTTESKEITDIISKCYYLKLKDYWESFRVLVNEEYKTIKNDLTVDKSICIEGKAGNIEKNWSIDELIAFMNTWTAVQVAIKQTNSNPLDTSYDKLKEIWNDGSIKKFTFKLNFINGRNIGRT